MRKHFEDDERRGGARAQASRVVSLPDRGCIGSMLVHSAGDPHVCVADWATMTGPVAVSVCLLASTKCSVD